MNRKRIRGAAVMLILMMLAAGCGGKTETTAEGRPVCGGDFSGRDSRGGNCAGRDHGTCASGGDEA